MKCKTAKIQDTDDFVPFNLIISVESREDAQALYAIFNYTHNTNLFPGCNGAAIKDALNSNGNFYVGAPSAVIANGVTYSKFYGGLIHPI